MAPRGTCQPQSHSVRPRWLVWSLGRIGKGKLWLQPKRGTPAGRLALQSSPGRPCCTSPWDSPGQVVWRRDCRGLVGTHGEPVQQLWPGPHTRRGSGVSARVGRWSGARVGSPRARSRTGSETWQVVSLWEKIKANHL